MKKGGSINAVYIILLILVAFSMQLMASPQDVDGNSEPGRSAAALNHQAEKLLNSDPDMAIATAKTALETAFEDDNREQLACAQKLIADAYYYKTDYLTAIEWYQASAETGREHNGSNSPGYQNRLGDVGYCYNELAMYDKAQEYYLMALKIARHRGDTEEMGTNLNNLGQSCFAMGDYIKAISYFDSTLQLDRQRQIDEYISIDLNNIGKVYFSWGKYDKALEYYFEALEKAEATGNEDMQAIRHSNIGQAYMALEDYENAKKHFNVALATDRRLGNTGKLGIRYSHIGMMNLKQGNYDTAQVYLEDAIRIFESQKMISSIVITLNDLGDLMREKMDFEKALDYYQRSLAISENAGMKANMLRSLRNIAETYRQSGNFRASVDYLLRFTSLKDTIFNEEKHRQLAEFEARYETGKKERENLLLRNEARIQRNQKIIFIISGSALLVVALTLLMMLNIKRKSLRQTQLLHEKDRQLHQLDLEKKEKVNQHLQDVLFAEEQINRLQTEKLQQKNRELSTATAHILNKNEVLGNIRRLAAGWLKRHHFDTSEELKKLIREIDSNTDLDEQWEQFKLHFESVHKGFFERLLKNFPKLTPNELKLCAYLRMNLSTKEIAQMLNISTESVTTKRYRLRKKLGLEKDENLVGFIGGF